MTGKCVILNLWANKICIFYGEFREKKTYRTIFFHRIPSLQLHINHYLFFSFSAAISMLMVGTVWGWSSPANVILTGESPPFNITDSEVSTAISLGTLGAIPGPLIGIFFINTIGRKPVILVTAIPIFVAWILIHLSKGPALLYTGRFLMSLAVGTILTVVPIYIGEIASPQIRGKLANLSMLLIQAGIFGSYCIGPFVSISTNALIMASIPIVFFSIFICMPETPYYYFWVNNTERSIETLEKLRGIENLQIEVEIIAERIMEEKDVQIMEVLKVKANQKALGLLFGAFAAQQLSGITAVMAYAFKIFEEIDSDFVSAQVSNIIFSAMGVTAVLISGFLVDHLGRRFLFICSALASCICYTIIATYLSLIYNNVDVSQYASVPTIALIVIPMMYGFGLGPLPYVYLGELIAPNFKTFASCVTSIWSSVLAYSVLSSYPNLIATFGIIPVLFVFAGTSLLGAGFALVFLPETKCKTLEEIQDLLKGSSR